MSDTLDMERRLREFAAAPNDADWSDVMRRAGERFPAPRFTRRRLAVVLVAAVVVAGSLAVFVPGNSTRSSAPTGRHGQTTPNTPTGPRGHFACCQPPPRQITIGELRAEAPYIPLPDSELANDGNAGDVFVTPGVQPEHPELYADVYYPSSGIKLRWTDPGIEPYPLTINGIPAKYTPGRLILDVLPTRLLALTAHFRSPDHLGVVGGRGVTEYVVLGPAQPTSGRR